MYIHEALAATDSGHPYITRKQWQEPSSWGPNFPKMLATHPRDGLAVKSVHLDPDKSRRRWAPAAEDLVADDWIAVN